MARTTSTSRKSKDIMDDFKIVPVLDAEDQVIRDNEAQKDLDKRIVRGKFVFYERPGGQLSFGYRRYKGEKVKNIILKDGSVYDLPWGIVRHLEEQACYKSHNIETQAASEGADFVYGEREVCVTKIGAPRYAFQVVA